MISFVRRTLLLAFTVCALAVFFQLPQLIHVMDSRFQGIPVSLNSDEDVYLARVQEALSGRPEQSSEAIVGDPNVLGTQMALLERMEGTFFQFTGWRAASVQQFMDSVTPPLLFLALVFLFSLCGMSNVAAYAGALAFVVIECYSLNRPVAQRDSILLLVVAMSAIIAGLENRWWWGMLGGAILGFLVGAYFWAWTFGWLWWGILLSWALIDGVRNRFASDLRRVWLLLLFGITGVVAAIPFLLEWWKVMHHPLAEYASFRSGLHPGFLPESLPYTVLFTIMAGGVAVAMASARPRITGRHRYVAVTIFSACIAINQQFVHGMIFNFVSHYLFSLVIAAIGVVLLWHAARGPFLAASAAAAVVYLSAIAYDGRYVLRQFSVSPDQFHSQHFGTLLPVLDSMPRVTILSDATTSAFVAGFTKHDVVYTVYLKNLLMTHEEIAERYCLTRLPIMPDERDLSGEGNPIYPDAVSAFRSDPTVRAREVAMIERACAAEDQDPAAYLRRYGVTYIVWDEKRQPRWKLERLGVPLEKVSESAAGEPGWSLWKVQQ